MRFRRGLFPGLISSVLALSSLSTLPGQTPQQYKQTNLVANATGAAVADPNLVNPWGLSRSSGGPWWVSDNGTGKSTLYGGTGAIIPLVVTIPPGSGGGTGSPTGTVFNGTTGFQIAPGVPAVFLFVTEDGTISGWNPSAGNTAVIAVNTHGGSSYKGATIVTVNDPVSGPAEYLFVADFARGRVEVFDTNFKHATSIEERFVRGDDENGQLPAGFAPFNVQNIGGNLYVAYAKQAHNSRSNEVDGPGLGFVNVYAPTGATLLRFQRGSFFNAPWGMVQASGDFGAYSHDILVGQFGSGEILAFNSVSGKYEGALLDATNNAIQISGVWGLSFGNGASAGSATALYFAAGANGEQGGLLGTLTPLSNPLGNDQ